MRINCEHISASSMFTVVILSSQQLPPGGSVQVTTFECWFVSQDQWNKSPPRIFKAITLPLLRSL